MSSSLKAQPLTDDVRSVLNRGAFRDGVFFLPAEQLDRKLYVAVNDALESLGGKWNKKAKGHVFARDAEDSLTAMLATGIVPAKNPDAFFGTPSAVVERMLELAEMENVDGSPPYLLEPSAGNGAITRAVVRGFPAFRVHAVEADSARALELALGDHCPSAVWNADFLTWHKGRDRYDRILMNPPFAVESDRSAWITHVHRALFLLAPRGLLVAVVPSSYSHRDDSRHRRFRDLVQSRSCYEPLGADAFKESGTGVNAGLLMVGGEK